MRVAGVRGSVYGAGERGAEVVCRGAGGGGERVGAPMALPCRDEVQLGALEAAAEGAAGEAEAAGAEQGEGGGLWRDDGLVDLFS